MIQLLSLRGPIPSATVSLPRIQRRHPPRAGDELLLPAMHPDLLKRLQEPDCFPGMPPSVELRQTHLSVICLAGERAYKLKKPVTLPFVDFSDAGVRKAICEEEVRLNRRLCSDIYLGVVPLRRTAEGSWSFREIEGEVVDHAVLMRRLPEERQMDRLLARDAVSPSHLEGIALIMAAFHERHPVMQASRQEAAWNDLAEAVAENFICVEPYAGDVFDDALLQALKARTLEALAQLQPLLAKRAHQGKVVDGHGDLHARNICLTTPPTIFDCLEFSSAYRCGDVAAENAFLAMDLIYRGHPELAQTYLNTYIATTGDLAQRQLIPFFISYRAMVRAKVAAIASADQDIDGERRQHEGRSARNHLLLAASALLDANPLRLIFCGLPGTGKSMLCQTLSRHSGWPVFSSDRLRKQLAEAPPEERLSPNHYTEEVSARVYERLIEQATHPSLASCIADANFPTRTRRRQAVQAAARHGHRAVIVWVDASEPTVRQHLNERSQDRQAVSDADVAVYEKLRPSFEAPTEDEGAPVVRIDGGQPTMDSLETLLCELLKAFKPSFSESA